MMYRPLWAQIDLAALRHNYRLIKKHVGRKVGIMAVVKQNAYGHGIIPVAKELAKLGADFFAVESIEEAEMLRQERLKQPILVLTAIMPQFAPAIIKNKLTATLVDLTFAKALNNAAKKYHTKVPVHVKVDTGMGRLGPNVQESFTFIQQLRSLKNLKLDGIFTHFPVADTDKEYTLAQIKLFNAFIEALKNSGVIFKYRHCANSAGIVDYPQSHFNLVRPGLILYGIRPSLSRRLAVKPVMSLKTRVVFVKEAAKGMTVSYGRTYLITNPVRVATMAVGYADGYQRALSNKAKVIINGRFYPVAGRVCMDHTMVDVGGRTDIKAGADVILIGRSGRLEITAQDLADWAGTIPYEITTCVSPRVPRVYNRR